MQRRELLAAALKAPLLALPLSLGWLVPKAESKLKYDWSPTARQRAIARAVEMGWQFSWTSRYREDGYYEIGWVMSHPHRKERWGRAISANSYHVLPILLQQVEEHRGDTVGILFESGTI